MWLVLVWIYLVLVYTITQPNYVVFIKKMIISGIMKDQFEP